MTASFKKFKNMVHFTLLKFSAAFFLIFIYFFYKNPILNLKKKNKLKKSDNVVSGLKKKN